jgi:signal transduction histidine kinase
VLVRDLDITNDAGDRRQLRVAVAENDALRGLSIQVFALQISLALGVVVVMLSVAGWLMVYLGLRPLEALRTSIEQVSQGKVERLKENVPVEFVPIVREVNGLLEVQERTIRLARERADDLAHGLKTPLSVMRATAERLRAAGDAANASGLDLLSYEMANRIDYQLRLTQLRIRAQNRGLSSSVDQALIRSVAVIRKTGRGAELHWHLSAAKVSADIDAHDLMELVGVLLENAAKWARADVQVSCSEANGRATFAVLDDGPGLSEELIRQLGVRGRRLDETKSGTGIGLAVASEIVRLNNGTVELSRGPTGGLNVAVSLPLAS